jgi:enoyl-[acyl-carrier protein] reductase II
MFEGDLEEGELEIGQVSALIDEILPVEKVFENLIKRIQ